MICAPMGPKIELTYLRMLREKAVPTLIGNSNGSEHGAMGAVRLSWESSGPLGQLR